MFTYSTLYGTVAAVGMGTAQIQASGVGLVSIAVPSALQAAFQQAFNDGTPHEVGNRTAYPGGTRKALSIMPLGWSQSAVLAIAAIAGETMPPF